ncbi:hypothetical protein T4D_13794 [Trichinella pseudospiralis]|uniref:Uncharacterized protein n=1 Tax=Trichinella pseudospiralis TaxID=6337 RepID=A0A0V1FD63_TRIPS|nr:hypothetical protein T4D_13794 [Trichinella pseudospiralis]
MSFIYTFTLSKHYVSQLYNCIDDRLEVAHSLKHIEMKLLAANESSVFAVLTDVILSDKPEMTNDMSQT